MAQITRRDVIKASGAGLSALALGTPLFAAETRRRPNVLLITTDQQRVDVMSMTGNPWAKTPHMDSLAAQGVYFTKSYCAYPLCSPSRSSLHTGRTPHENCVNTNAVGIDTAMPLSGQVFRAAGYETAYAGKWHLPAGYPTAGIAGYEVLNKISAHPRQPARRISASNGTWHGQYANDIAQLAHDVDDATVGASVEFLKRRRDKPFLLVASFLNPHDICMLTSEDTPLFKEVGERYAPAAGRELPPLPSDFALTAGEPDMLAQHPRHPEWDESRWRRYRHAYFGMLEDVDRQVGKVLDALRQTGQEDNTVVVFTSDHGEGLGSHHWAGKMSFYEAAAAVPLIVSWKGVTPAGRLDRHHLVSTFDFLPTICDYAGVRPPPMMRGASLREVIERPERPGREFVVSEMASRWGRSFMVRTERHKYMVFPGSGRTEMLVDLVSDPGEMLNLAGEPASTAELDRHRRLLAQWRKTTEEGKYPMHPGTGKPRKA